MAQESFNQGDVVYHKANNLRMVVVEANDTKIRAVYVEADGSFKEAVFQHFLLSKLPIPIPGHRTADVLYQMQSKP